MTLHTSRVKKNLVLHKRLVQGLSVAEVVEAGEVPGSKKMTTLSCSLGSYNSWPRKYKITCKSRDPASCWQWAQGVLGMTCTCIRGKIPTGADLFNLICPHSSAVVRVPRGVILAAFTLTGGQLHPACPEWKFKTPSTTNKDYTCTPNWLLKWWVNSLYICGTGSSWGSLSVFGSQMGPHYVSSRSPFSLFQA